MAAYFLDTSAVVKRYIQETGSTWVRAIADPLASHLIYLARITDVEVTSAVIRRQRGGTLSAPAVTATLRQFRQDLVLGYRIIGITSGLLSAATLLVEKHGLRAYDAVQRSLQSRRAKLAGSRHRDNMKRINALERKVEPTLMVFRTLLAA